jgi:polar amino acid transport system substrate-binding protein
MITQSPRKALLWGIVILTSALSLAGCGGSDNDNAVSSTTTATTSGATNLSAQVPAKIKSKGALTVAADPTYAPNEFVGSDGKTIVGMSPDLATAVFAKLGLKVKMTKATFDGIIPGLQSGKYDIGFSSFTDTKEREKVVDFVTYFEAGTSFYVANSGGPAINGLADLCGHTVAVERGTTQADDATSQSAKCKTAGKRGVTVKVFPDQNAANLALASGRGDVGMADSPVAAYIVEKSNGKFKLSGKLYGPFPYGIAIPKDSGMAKPTLAAVKAIMADGTYDKVLKKWGLEDGAITDPKINAAIS